MLDFPDVKNRDVFSLYKPLNKVVSQSLKEGTNFTILRTGNVELWVVFKVGLHTVPSDGYGCTIIMRQVQLNHPLSVMLGK